MCGDVAAGSRGVASPRASDSGAPSSSLPVRGVGLSGLRVSALWSVSGASGAGAADSDGRSGCASACPRSSVGAPTSVSSVTLLKKTRAHEKRALALAKALFEGVHRFAYLHVRFEQ